MRTVDVVETFAVPSDAPAGTARAGSPIAITTDVGERLASARRSVWWVAVIFTSGLAAVFATLQWVSERSRTRLETANSPLRAQNAAALAEELDVIRESNIRCLSHRLPPGVIRLSAAAGLRSLRDFYETLVPLELDITSAVIGLEAPIDSPIPEPTRLGIYRIAEMALSNVARHAGASQCSMRLDSEHESQNLVLEIYDDGAGFDPYGTARGLGLINMGDYADWMTGELAIRSSRGQGTHLTLRVPFSAPGNASDGSTANGARPVIPMGLAHERIYAEVSAKD